MEIAGSLVNGLLQSFQSIHALTGEDISNVVSSYPVDNSAWYEYEVFDTIFSMVAEKHGDIDGLIFRAGMEFIKGWYHFGGGKEIVHSSTDFIRLQADNGGYGLIVRGENRQESGWLELEFLEEATGSAKIIAFTPFPPHFSRGVFVGGLNLFEDLDFVDVRAVEHADTPNPKLFHVSLSLTFVKKQAEVTLASLESALEGVPPAIRTHTTSLHWKYQGLQKQIENEKEYRDQLNHLLIKNAEAVQRKNKELAELLAQLKETQQQLIQQEKMASLGQLTAGIAHEINNPVNYVANSTLALRQNLDDLQPLFDQLTSLPTENAGDVLLQLLQTTQEVELAELLPEIGALLKSIQSGSERIQLIVRGLKTFSHQADDAYEFANLSELLDSTITILSNRLAEKHLTIQRDYQTQGRLYCNAGKLNQALLNILDNAIYASDPQGQIMVQLTADQAEVTISVIDKGSGMDKRTLQQVFDPFFTTKTSGAGTGLGLYLCYGIIYKDHYGRITIDSKPGKGTNFRVHLPKNISERAKGLSQLIQ
ncbi:MAG: ATP-binding protein [Bacteroidota bacterium]